MKWLFRPDEIEQEQIDLALLAQRKAAQAAQPDKFRIEFVPGVGFVGQQVGKVDYQKIRSAHDLCEIAAKYTQLKRLSIHEMDGPCPKCAQGPDNTKRFHVSRLWFFCRHCHPQRGDVVDFQQWIKNDSLQGALADLDETPAIETTVVKTPWANFEEWQDQTTSTVRIQHQRLLCSDEAETARQYLSGRQIMLTAWQTYQLGYDPAVALPGTKGKLRAPAISIPWYRLGKIVGLRYRFLEHQKYTDTKGDDRVEKQTAKWGSQFQNALFGTRGLTPRTDMIFITEGEINAMSIRIAGQGYANVVSIGSEGQKIAEEALSFIRSHAQIVAWTDKAYIAKAVAYQIAPGRAFAIASPAGKDANDFLRSGELTSLIIKFKEMQPV